VSEPNSQYRGKESREAQGNGATLFAGEVLRSGTASLAAAPARGEERISLFWRVFGGTLLSLAGLVTITVYQQFNNTIHDLRNDLSRLAESRGELVKKDEFNSRMTSVWNSVKDAQAANASVTALKERSTLLEQQVKAGEEERKELLREVQRLRERLVVVEGRAAANPNTARPATPGD
jgi:hypothetical protein